MIRCLYQLWYHQSTLFVLFLVLKIDKLFARKHLNLLCYILGWFNHGIYLLGNDLVVVVVVGDNLVDKMVLGQDRMEQGWVEELGS